MKQHPFSFFFCRVPFAATLFLLLGGTIAIIGCSQKSAPEGDAKTAGADEAVPVVSVATVQVGAIEQMLPATGTLLAPRDRQAVVTAPVAGMLDFLPLRAGQQVTRGQIVARLSTRPLMGQIQQAQATVAQNSVQVQQAQASALQQSAQSRSGILQAQAAVSVAQAALAGAEATLTGAEAAVVNAQQNLERTRTLFGDGLVAQKDVETAQLALRTAIAQRDAQKQTVTSQRETIRSQEQAVSAARAAALQDAVKQKDVQIARDQLQNARGALTTAQSQVDLYTVRAPLSGVVTNIGASLGESVDTTTKLATITDLNRLSLQIAIPSASASMIHAGQRIRFSVDALPGRTFSAMIRSVGTQIDPASSTLTATAFVDNSRHQLKDNMYAHVQIQIARHNQAYLLPRAAVRYEPGTGEEKSGNAAHVLVIGADGKIHQTAVTTGISTGDTVEILSGIKSGDRVVTTGGYGLEDGTKVTVADAAEHTEGAKAE